MKRAQISIAVGIIVVSTVIAAGIGSSGGYGYPTTTHKGTTTSTLNSTTTVVGTNPNTAPTTTINQCPNPPCVPNTQGVTTTTSAPTTTAMVATTTTVPPTSTSVEPTTTTSSPPSTTMESTTTSTTSVASSTTSTTTILETTTTTLPETFTFGAALTVCVREVPFIRINFQNTFPELAGQTGTLTMEDINGNVVSTQSLVYQPGTTVDLLYPGTSVNPDGSIDDVPGWILTDDGFWIRDPSDEFLREGILLTYTVNPTATAFVTYPPESSACANPDGPFRPLVGILPATS